jgi:signal transduction histidine kinase
LFTEKNLPRLIIVTPIILVLLFALLIIYFFINTQYNNFQKESIELEKEYLVKQKNILKDENNKILQYINYHRDVENRRIHNRFRELTKSGVEVTEEAFELYENNAIKELKQRIIDWTNTVRYGTNGYIWIHDTTHHLIAHPFRTYSVGKDDTNNTDSTGTKIFQQFINIAKNNLNGGFLEYYWAKPEFGAPRKKIGFLKLDPEWGWVIGTGLYIDDIESSLFKKKLLLENKIDKYVQIILLTAFSLMIILGLMSYFISKYIAQIFTEYREKVDKKEQALKEFNTMLKSRIDAALEEAKRKDKTLLQQSKLAQMGEMISMIAHQWRQPLCEISGIFMEMETAAKFGKVNQEFIQKESKEGTQIIEYMSKTIDDFRNFFKPAKTKKNFSLSDACKEATTLASASLKNKNIRLELHVKKVLHVKGYASEFAQVILNLILNAKDALIERNIQNPLIVIEIKEDGLNILVSISDNAGGIDEKILERIFEPYISTKKSAGTGLGLYMAKMIIEENMGGTIYANNEGKGAVFCIKI